MRLRRRIADALRNPRRMGALLRRVGELAVRGELPHFVSRVRPRGPTAAEYRAWRAVQVPLPPSARGRWCLIAIDPREPSSRAAMLAAFRPTPQGSAAVIVRGPGGGWTCDGGGERPLHAWLDQSGVSWIGWIDEPMTPSPDAIDAFARACTADARIAYGDHEVGGLGVFKSAWDREQLAQRDYLGPMLMVHADLAEAIDAAPATRVGARRAKLLDAAWRLPDAAVVHVPRMVASVHEAGTSPPSSREGAEGRAAPPNHSVSIVIPTRDRAPMLARCIAAIEDAGFPPDGEFVIVDNGSVEPATARFLEEIRNRRVVTIVAMPGPFNFAALCNAGVAAARRRIVVLLNNDTEVRAGWLDELAGSAAREDIGAVGPLLLYPDGRVQSAGVLVGVNRTATSALEGFARDDPLARDWCATRRRISAVMGACLAVERAKYLRVGGMDERLAVSHNEVDLCLRLEAQGLANLFTPFATVLHEEGATRGFELTAEERARLEREIAFFRARWGEVLNHVDPAHHPALARQGNAFALVPIACEGAPRAGWRSPPLSAAPDR